MIGPLNRIQMKSLPTVTGRVYCCFDRYFFSLALWQVQIDFVFTACPTGMWQSRSAGFRGLSLVRSSGQTVPCVKQTSRLTRRVASSELSAMEPSSKDPLVRRRTVITLGSAGRTIHPEPDSTSEVLETVSGRISITVKNLPAAKLVEQEEPTRDDPCWITVRHVESPAPPAVPLRKSVSACEMKPVFKMKLGNESKILRLAEQAAFKKRPAPPIPSSEPTVQKSEGATNDNKKFDRVAEVKTAETVQSSAAKSQDKIPAIPYSEWLKTHDAQDEKPRVSFDHKYQGEALMKPMVAEREVAERKAVVEPLIEVIETEKSNTPKSILKNVRRNSDAGSFVSSRPSPDTEPDKLLAWKMEYHQREALVGSRLRALVARADEFFINHQNSSRLFPASPFHLPDIESLKLPLSADDESCHSSASSSVESFPELKFNTSTSSEEFGKTKRREPTPDVTKDSSSSNESVAHPQVRNSYQSTPDRRYSVASSNEPAIKRHSNPVPNPNRSFKPITSPIYPVKDELLVKDAPKGPVDVSACLKSGMPIDKATEIVRQFFQTESDRSRRSSPTVIPPKKWSQSQPNLLADEPSPRAAPSSSSCESTDTSPPTSAPSSCVSQGSQSERGRPQMRSRIPVRVNRPTSTCIGYNRSTSLCNNQSPITSSQARASSVGSRRIWSSSSAITLMTSNNTAAHYYHARQS